MFLFSVMPAQLSWQLFCVCTSPYSWVGNSQCMFGDETCKCFNQLCKLIYTAELLKEAFLSKCSLFVQGQYKSSCAMEMRCCSSSSKSVQYVQGSWLSLGLELEALQVGTVVAFCPFFRCRRICLWCKARSQAAVLCKEDCHRRIGKQ